jgi:AAA+ ATPase superfamily predicted ATPase
LKISISGIILADVFYTLYKDKFNKYYFSKIIEKGTQPEVNISPLQYISQPEIVEYFKRMFKPQKNQSFYHVICGEYGIGKTTLVKEALKEARQGVIYINIPTNLNDLDKAFEKALKNFNILPSEGLMKPIARRILGFKTINGKFIIKIL